MPRRFTGIRLLLAIVVINLILFAALAVSVTSEHPWLARVLPGQFGAGVNSSGYWVFFALVLLIDAVSVLLAGLVLALPAMRDAAPSDERRLARHLVDRGGVSEDSKTAVLVALREEALAAHRQLVVGRTILVAGLLFLAAAFGCVSLSFARAAPQGRMFAVDCAASCALAPFPNDRVDLNSVEMFTLDQITGAVLLDAPEIYRWRVSPLENNPQSPLFAHFVFGFRTLVGFVTLLILASFTRRRQAPEKPKKAAEVVAEAEAAA
jgi:hypothetical protein